MIDASIDHANKTMVSKANLDVYSTAEPQVVILDLFLYEQTAADH